MWFILRVLRLSLVAICLTPISADANDRFTFESVAAIAKKSAAAPYRAPTPVPDFLTAISYDDYRDIRFDTGKSLWRDGGRFQVQFIHPGLFYNHSVAVNVIDGDGVRAAAYSPKLFSFGRNKFADKVPADLGFAGFRIAYPLNQRGEFNHVVVFAGASYFRAVAKGQVFGLSTRGLAIDTGLPSGEEFPSFTEFWLERPRRDARELNLYALLDSPSVTGAYSFLIRPGERTVVDVRARLFQRKAVKELGIAPLTSMFFFGEGRSRLVEDWRPEVHDSDGLLMHSGSGEWIWRPLGNPEKLRVSYFEFDNPRGFGLLQRDRRFQNYQDLETRHELRPNAWITPVGDWGKGFVKLVEIPSRKEIAYRISFQSEEPIGSGSARAIATRTGAGDKEELKRIVIDFAGQKIQSLPESTPLKAVIATAPDGQAVAPNVFRNTVTGGWRLSFQVKRQKGRPVELRAFLQNGKDVLTETWSYQLES